MATRGVDVEHIRTVTHARHFGDSVTIDSLRRLSGGASRESWSFDAVVDGRHHALVLRRDPGSNLGGSERSTEYRLLQAAAAAGVPVPTVRFLLEPTDDLGDGFVMDRIHGETIPRRILRDDEYADARPRLAAQCGAIAAQIHAVDVASLPKLSVQGPQVQIDQYRGILDMLGEPHPAFELGLRWLEDHLPGATTDSAPRLVHGDFRNGNFIVGPEGIRSVLDWELSHLGDPVEDLGWLCVKSWRFGHVDQPVGGFGPVDVLLAAYDARGGWNRRPRAPPLLGDVRHAEVGRHLRDAELQPPARVGALGRARRARTPDRGDGVGPPGADRMTLHDRPTASELVAAVREYLERDVMATTEGRVAFHARVAVNVLGMVERELELGAAQDAAEHERLVALLGRPGTVRELTEALGRGIRDDALEVPWSELVEVVRGTVRAKLEVANPGYLDR